MSSRRRTKSGVPSANEGVNINKKASKYCVNLLKDDGRIPR